MLGCSGPSASRRSRACRLPPSSAQADDCKPAAIEALRAAAPEGFAIYQKIKDKTFFLNWISCGEEQLGLPTAVHESVHYITAETDAFPLVDGGQVKRPHEVSAFFAPSLIAGKFKARRRIRHDLSAAGQGQLIDRFPLSAR